jgi:hypothetical protein
LDLARSLNGASVYLAMNGQDKNQLNRAKPAATVDAILGKLDGQPPDKQGFSGCIFCEDEERGYDTVARPSLCNRETAHPSLRFFFSDADLSNDHHEQFKLRTMLCQCGRLESCSAWLEVHAVITPLQGNMCFYWLQHRCWRTSLHPSYHIAGFPAVGSAPK